MKPVWLGCERVASTEYRVQWQSTTLRRNNHPVGPRVSCSTDLSQEISDCFAGNIRYPAVWIWCRPLAFTDQFNISIISPYVPCIWWHIYFWIFVILQSWWKRIFNIISRSKVGRENMVLFLLLLISKVMDINIFLFHLIWESSQPCHVMCHLVFSWQAQSTSMNIWL